MKRKLKYSGRFALTSIAAAALCLASPVASALGLGRLNVQSSLGEVLRAEIDITSMTAEEQANLRIRIAPPESYRAANVDYNPVLPTTRATLEKRADGRLFVRLVSERGVQEPFVDVILEVSWATGRLVREYTLLFDPPTSVRAAASTPAPAGVTTSPVITASPRPPVALEPTAPTTSARETREAARAEARQRRDAERAAAAEARASAARTASEARGTAEPSQAARGPAISGDEYRVRSGDSLSKIAGRTQRPGVSLDQMLVSLFRANPDAFVGSNMNRLRAGVVLSVPSAEAAQGVTTAEARQTITAQSADFGAYRQRLASSTLAPRDEPSKSKGGGKVTASVDDKKQSATPTPDKLTLTKPNVAPGAAAASAEARLSSEQAKKADAARIAELNKNLDALKRLPGASQAAPAAPAVPAPSLARPAPATTSPTTPPPVVIAAAPTPTPTPAPTPAPAPAPAAAPAVPTPSTVAPPAVSVPATPPAPPATAATAASSVPAVPAVPSVVVTPPLVTASASAPAPAVARPASAAVAPRPSRPATAPAPEPGLVDSLLANPLYLLGGLLAVLLAAFGIYRFTQRSKKDSGETSFLESRLQPDSFFGASGGQRIDTRDAAGSSSSMTYSLSQLDAIGDVDPVAEADVYLAYGRDLQAEEILKEAMRSNPERLAIRTKLLEVYAKRRDIKGFELLATQLFALTRGEGDDWAKAQELGAQIDPDNNLYRDGGAPEHHLEGAPTRPEPLGASTMPQSITPTQSQFGHSNIDTDLRDSQLTDIDLDLDNPDVGVPSTPVPLDTTEAIAPRPAAPVAFQASTLRMPLVPNEASAEPDRRDEPLVFDLSGITLDLDPPSSGAKAMSDGGDLAVVEDDSNGDPVSRKMELAEEFQRIGDKDGARDLLREVLTTATGSTKSKAQSMLEDLG